MTDRSLSRIVIGTPGALRCTDCNKSVIAVGWTIGDVCIWADNHLCPNEELPEVLAVLRLLTDETPCTVNDLSPAGLCPHGWVHQACPDRRAWEILKRHPETEPSLPGNRPQTPPKSAAKLLTGQDLRDALNLDTETPEERS